MRKFLVFLVVILISPITGAVTLPDLYTGRVSVSSQSPETRVQALQQAFEQVITKMSSSDTVLNKPVIQTAVSHADNYLQEYGYQRMQFPSGPALALTATFNSHALEELLSKANIPVWGKNRPLVLVWLAIKMQSDKVANETIINNEDNSLANRVLNYFAGIRGLPIILPINDIQNLQSLSFEDLWQYRLDAIKKASERYGSDVILVATITQLESQQWFSHWLLLIGDQQNGWNFTGNSLQQIIEQGVDQTSESLSNHYALVSNDTLQNQVQLVVTGIKNVNDYAKVQHYLQQLTPIKKIEVQSVAPDAVVFNLEIVGGLAALQQAISVDQMLQPLNNGSMISQNSDPNNLALMYQWQS